MDKKNLKYAMWKAEESEDTGGFSGCNNCGDDDYDDDEDW
jgi:hypothetical protein